MLMFSKELMDGEDDRFLQLIMAFVSYWSTRDLELGQTLPQLMLSFGGEKSFFHLSNTRFGVKCFT